MGDLNTFSPVDVSKTKRKIDKFLLQNPKYNGLRSQLYDMARARVIESLFQMGVEDASTNHEETFPTLLANISKEPLIRIDFCLYKNLGIKSFEILKGELYEKTSDHYPVLVEI